MTKTVSYANVHLTYTADAAGLRQAKADMAAMNRVINQTKSDTERYEEHVQKLDRLLANGKITQEQYNRGLEAARKKYLETNKEVAKAIDYQKQYNTALANNKARLAATPTTAKAQASDGTSFFGVTPATIAFTAATAKATYEAKQSVQAFADLESTLVTLQVVYGDAKRASQDFATMRQMAAVSPLEAKDFTRSAQIMAQYGVAVNEIIPRLSAISEVAAGNSERMYSLSLAFGQVAAAGRLTGQEVLQMVNAGFNPLAEISRTTGRSMRDLRDDMANGLITYEMVAKAFDTATGAGGRFEGMNEKLATTVSAKQAQIRDEITKTKEAFGELFAAMIPFETQKGFLQFTQFMAQGFKSGDANMNKAEAAARLFGVNRWQDVSMQDIKTLLSLPGGKGVPTVKPIEEAKKSTNMLGKSIVDFGKSLATTIQSAGVTYTDTFAKFEAMAKQGGQAAVEASIKQRAAAEEKRKRELQNASTAKAESVNSELSAAVSAGSREAFDLISRLQQTQQQKQLEFQRQQLVEQKAATKILKELNNKGGIGVVK